MKVEIKIQRDITDAYAVIHTNKLTTEIAEAVEYLEKHNQFITAENKGCISVLNPNEIYMVRIENEKTIIYSAKEKYYSAKRLYQLEAILGTSFMKISKSSLINLKKIDFVEPSLGGMMGIVLKNGCKDYISRRYLPDFKKYLGI